MKIMLLYGGLGNQMFQYATALAIMQETEDRVYLDTSLSSHGSLHNRFELKQIFNITGDEATRSQIDTLSHYSSRYFITRFRHKFVPARKSEYRERKFGTFYPQVVLLKGDVYFDGYWQHYQYFDRFRELILSEFSLKQPLDRINNNMLLTLSKSTNAVSVHVRRGDYVNHKLYRGICCQEYYQNAFKIAKSKIGPDVQYFIFSDDIDWCKSYWNNTESPTQIHFVDWNNGQSSYKDMILMSACRINIIANSSFSWWAAYLNNRPDKIVIAPAEWINDDVENDIQMPDWIRV